MHEGRYQVPKEPTKGWSTETSLYIMCKYGLRYLVIFLNLEYTEKFSCESRKLDNNKLIIYVRQLISKLEQNT